MVMSCVSDIITVDLCSLEDALYMLLLTAFSVFSVLAKILVHLCFYLFIF